MMNGYPTHHWAIILGGSSGIGLATAKKLAAHGMSLFLVFRERRAALRRVEPELDELAHVAPAMATMNVDALSQAGQTQIMKEVQTRLGEQGRVALLLHSIAFGHLKRLLPSPQGDDRLLTSDDWAHTTHAMGTSLAEWVQQLHHAGRFAERALVLALTSEGNRAHWDQYGAVSAAKGALEAVARAVAVEGAPHGIRANVLQPGVIDTPALRLIPGSERLLTQARERNPSGRLTQPEDVANAIHLLCQPEAQWINGAVLTVDGGEHLR